MHYWNRDNFEGLFELANALEANSSDLSLLSEYCRNREKGLRNQAFQSLQQFLEVSNAWPESDAREKCAVILELQSLVPHVHQFLSQPLLKQFIEPVLQKWLSEAPDNYQALRWSGLLHWDANLLFKALEICPEDKPVRSKLISMHIDEVDYATHHLDEGYFIGDFDDAVKSLEIAKSLLEAGLNSPAIKGLTEEIAEYKQLLDDWASYTKAPTGTFPEWCASKGRQYTWSIRVYYDGD